MSRPLFALLLGLVLVVPTLSADAANPIRDSQRKVVKIFGAGGIARLYGYGTGFLVSPQGHIVTVWSTVLDTETVTVILDDGRKFQARILGAEPQLDLAVLQLIPNGVEDLTEEELEKLTPNQRAERDELIADLLSVDYFKQEDFATAPVGTRVYAFSNMFKVATGDEPVSVLHGVIASRDELKARSGTFDVPYTGPVYIVDAITNNPGAGGGVLTTRDGKLLGMIGKELKDRDSNTWINYAVPIGNLKRVIQSIIDGEYLPVDPGETRDLPPNYEPVDFGLILVPDVVFRTPAFVDAVLPDSLAARAGLKPDDRILFINDEQVLSCRLFKRQLGALDDQDDVKLLIRRGDKLVTINMIAPKMKK